MKKHHLAIPVVAVVLAVLPTRVISQTKQLALHAQISAVRVQTPTPNALADEEMGRLHMAKKEFSEAEAIFRRLTLENPRNALYWNELGIVHHNLSELDQAYKCYEKASKLDPNYADARNNMGTILYEKKKYPKAIRAYKKAIAIRNDFAPFYLNLGYAYFGEKNFEDSITSFRKAYEIDPNSFDPNRSRTGTIIQDRSVTTDRGKFYFLLAKSFAASGDAERCILYLRKARDEGYEEFNKAKTDPAFASVLKSPAAQELFAPRVTDTVQP